MNKKIDPDIIRLKDILKYIDYVEDCKSRLEDFHIMMACAYYIAIIGEASTKLSQPLKDKNTHISWYAISGVRNRIIHEYGKVNIERLKEILKNDIPKLKSDIVLILNSISQ